MNRKFLLVLLVLVLCVVGAGFSRGWFALTSPRDTENNTLNINLAVDADKAKQDAGRLKDKATELTGKTTE
jgi:hypothetical protein